MAIDRVMGVAVLSGKGGVGKSVVALNLALAMGKTGVKTLLLDAGGGGLNHLANTGEHDGEGNRQIISINDNVSLYNSMVSDSYSILSEQEIESFLGEIIDFSAGYGCVIFDSLTGVGPVSFTLAGISERSLLVTTGDPTAIASTYAFVKALHQDGLASRCSLLFNMVESADEAASLKTRFDILTERFLNTSFEQLSHIHYDSQLAESVMEQQPLLAAGNDCRATADFIRLSDLIKKSSGFQFETSSAKS